jgi:hypothetical protein
LPSPNLRLRMLRSVLVVLREWAMSIYSHRMGAGAPGSSLVLGGGFSLERTVASQGIRDKITSVANRLTSLNFHKFTLFLWTFLFASFLPTKNISFVAIPCPQYYIIFGISRFFY